MFCILLRNYYYATCFVYSFILLRKLCKHFHFLKKPLKQIQNPIIIITRNMFCFQLWNCQCITCFCVLFCTFKEITYASISFFRNKVKQIQIHWREYRNRRQEWNWQDLCQLKHSYKCQQSRNIWAYFQSVFLRKGG